MAPPDENERRPRAESGAHDDGDDVSTTVQPAIVSVGDLLALSDERDQWLARLLAAERDAYRRGYDDGRAAACVAIAEIEEHYTELAWWRDWWAKVRRADAAALAQADPRTLTVLQSCALRRIRGAPPGEPARWDAA
jgi:hypothetical protein